jgi:hypothetical protein
MSIELECPLCRRPKPEELFVLRNSPLLQNELARSSQEALTAPRVDVAYYYCPQCRFAFNPRFDRSCMDYVGYYNDQSESIVYRQYIDVLTESLRSDCRLGPESTILEIGSGSGYFLAQLKAKTGARHLLGYDGAYKGRHGMQDHIRPKLFDAGDITTPVDLIVLRHCLEGLLDVEHVTALLSGPMARRAHLYIEITNLDYILEEQNPALLFHEYYRYFSLRATDVFLHSVGFKIAKMTSVFGQSYLSILASPTSEPTTLDGGHGALETVVRQHHKVVIWGISGRSISLLSHMSWDKSVVAFGVDIDPRRQGKYVPVTGQRILSPSEAAAFEPDLVIVANEIYAQEIRETLGKPTRFVTIQGRNI